MKKIYALLSSLMLILPTFVYASNAEISTQGGTVKYQDFNNFYVTSFINNGDMRFGVTVQIRQDKFSTWIEDYGSGYDASVSISGYAPNHEHGYSVGGGITPRKTNK